MHKTKRLVILLLFTINIIACRLFSPNVVPTPTPDNIATGVAEARAIAATLTSEATISQPTTIIPTVQPTNASIIPYSFPTQPKIYFSIGTDVYAMNLNGTDLEIIAQTNTQGHLFVDELQKKVYVLEWSGEVLVFDIISGKSEVIEGAGWGGQGVAFDANTSKLFLGLYYNGLFVMDLRNNNNRLYQLVGSEKLSPLLGQSGQLQIDSSEQKIYFRTAFNGDCGECRYLYRVDFSGENLAKIIPMNGGNALALDIDNKKIYYSDVPGNGTIKRANIDGTKVEVLFRLSEPYIFCRALTLDLKHQKIYFTLMDEKTWLKMAIARSNLDGSEFEILFETIGNPGDDAGGVGLFFP
jgi:hypothetical protein